MKAGQLREDTVLLSPPAEGRFRVRNVPRHRHFVRRKRCTLSSRRHKWKGRSDWEKGKAFTDARRDKSDRGRLLTLGR